MPFPSYQPNHRIYMICTVCKKSALQFILEKYTRQSREQAPGLTDSLRKPLQEPHRAETSRHVFSDAKFEKGEENYIKMTSELLEV